MLLFGRNKLVVNALRERKKKPCCCFSTYILQIESWIKVLSRELWSSGAARQIRSTLFGTNLVVWVSITPKNSRNLPPVYHQTKRTVAERWFLWIQQEWKAFLPKKGKFVQPGSNANYPCNWLQTKRWHRKVRLQTTTRPLKDVIVSETVTGFV